LLISKLQEQGKIVTLQFKVIDSGIGIEEDKLPKIFDLFTQANMDSAKKYGGTGLGLSITKQLIELHGGRIWAESKLGEGSLFFVEIPFEKSEQMPKEAESSHYQTQNIPSNSINIIKNHPTEKIETKNENSNGQQKIETKTTEQKQEIISDTEKNIQPEIKVRKTSILLAEDNTFNQMLAKTVISKYMPDADLTIAANGKEVMKQLETNKIFDVILMDVQMPEMDGYETTRTIRKAEDKTYQHIPIIACTAGVTPPEVEECYKSGMDDFLAKPFQPNDLVSKINHHLKQIS
jgi:two-component system, sensor histidine kinase